MKSHLALLLIIPSILASAVNASATTSVSTTPISIYVAIRNDNVAGTGSAQSPYDASTEAKFDAILANLLAKNGAQPIVLHLAAGTYIVTPVREAPTAANPGGYVSNIPPNLEIIGAGESKTIIRAGIVTTAASTYWLFAQIGISAGDTFENLTIDCNIQNQTVSDVTIDGIEYLHVAGGATRTIASRVHVIDGGNHAGDPGDSEWFGIVLDDYQSGTVAEITNCRVDQYQGKAGCTALVATTEITNNVVILNNNDPDGLGGNGGGGGFQDALSPSGIISGNRCQQCTWGVYSDVGSAANVTIENNVFNTLYGGVWLYNWSANTSLTDIYIHNNTITKTYEPAAIIGCPATMAVNSNIYFYDNVITTIASSTLTTDNLIYLTAAQNSKVYDNVFSVSPSSKISLPTGILLPDDDLGTIAWYSNKFSNGTVIPAPAGTVAHALTFTTTN